MPFKNRIQLTTIQYLGLFDDIPYKYIKNMIDKDDEDYYKVEIMELEWVPNLKTRFKLTLSVYISQGIYIDKIFTIVKEYKYGSDVELVMCSLFEYDSDEE